MDARPNPTTAVNPSPESVAVLASRPDHDAIIMVNLLRFEPEGGRESYRRYGAVASRTVAARGGSIAYSAPVIGGTSSDEPPPSQAATTGTDRGDSPMWDTVTLVRYPRRSAYLDMQNDPAYVGAIPDRTRGLAARLLHPFHAVGGDPDDPFTVDTATSEEVLVVTLVRLAAGSSWQPSGEVVLRLQADTPLVTDGRWDELIVTRYPNAEAVPPGPIAGVDASLVLVTQPGADR